MVISLYINYLYLLFTVVWWWWYGDDHCWWSHVSDTTGDTAVKAQCLQNFSCLRWASCLQITWLNKLFDGSNHWYDDDDDDNKQCNDQSSITNQEITDHWTTLEDCLLLNQTLSNTINTNIIMTTQARTSSGSQQDPHQSLGNVDTVFREDQLQTVTGCFGTVSIHKSGRNISYRIVHTLILLSIFISEF